MPSPPLFAGTFWYSTTRDFVKANAAAAKRLGPATVDGVPVEVFEWTVSPAERDKAFHGFNALTRNGGKLRLNVAPSLGHVLPRIEYVGEGGVVAAVFSATEFRKVDNVHIPRRCSLRYFSKEGPGFFIEINEDALGKLPADVRKTLLDMRPQLTEANRASYVSLDPKARDALIERGMKSTPVTDADLIKMREAAKPVVEQWAARLKPDARKIYDTAKTMIDAHYAAGGK